MGKPFVPAGQRPSTSHDYVAGRITVARSDPLGGRAILCEARECARLLRCGSLGTLRFDQPDHQLQPGGKPNHSVHQRGIGRAEQRFSGCAGRRCDDFGGVIVVVDLSTVGDGCGLEERGTFGGRPWRREAGR